MTNDYRSVLFVDICDSTRLLETLGDERGRAVLVSCLATLRGTAGEHHGTVLDEIGDELMVSFADALSAARAACAMQVAVADAVALGALPPGVHVRIGFHHGPVVIHEDGLFGKTVHLARRVASVSKAQQIVTSRQSLDLIPSGGEILSRYFDTAHVKGHDDVLEMHEILWDAKLGTLVDIDLSQASAPIASMRLLITYGDRTLEASATRPVVTLGRGEHCDLVIENDRISRLHGRVEFRKGRYVYVDASSNGSYLRVDGQSPVFLRRDERGLRSDGSIQLGGNDPGAPVVRLTLREETPPPER